MPDIFNEVELRRHRLREELFPSYLPKTEGKLIARTVNEAMLTVEEVCAAMKERGGFKGDPEEAAEHVLLFLREAAYQMCDGFGINMRLFSMYLNVGGLFETVHEPTTPDKHPVDVHFLVREPLRRLLALVDVDIVGLAESGAFIDQFTDVKTGAVNEVATPNGPFRMLGTKIRILGDPEKAGVFFVPTDNPDGGVKVTENLIENDPSKIFGIIPDLPADKTWNLEARTQYTHGETLLKDMRIITSRFTLAT